MTETLGSKTIDLEFRRAELDDLDEIWDLYSSVIMASSNTPEDPQWVLGVHPSREELTYQIEDGLLHCGFYYGQVVAAALIEQNFVRGYETFPWESKLPLRDTAVLHLFAVDPNLRGRKIGKQFMNYCIDFSRKEGYKALRLDAMPCLVHAQALYVSCGFKNQGVGELSHSNPKMRRANMYELVL